MLRLINLILRLRFWSLFLKEMRQIKHDKQLIIALIMPPTIQLILFGFALNPEVTNLRLGVVDESRTTISREMVSSFTTGEAFKITGYYPSSMALGEAIKAGDLDAGLIVPSDFAQQTSGNQPARVQVLFDAVNSNTAATASGYAQRIINAFNKDQNENGSKRLVKLDGGLPESNSLITRVSLFYNPGLKNSWFMITGVLGILLTLNGSLVASAAMVKEKEAGTVEQLLMTPASASEVILAKMSPLFLLLSADVGLALFLGWLVFDLPIRGSLLLIYSAGALCVLCGIGLGTFLATFSRSQQQAQLLSFFVNPPIALLAGGTTPIEGMPAWVQPLTYLNPVRHFTIISRGVLLKGAGIEILYPYLLALIAFAILLVGVSAWRFRKQLG